MRRNTVIAVFGRKGLGKTYMVKHLCRNCRRMILIDSMREYENGKIIYSFDELLNETEAGEYRCIFRPLDPKDFDNAASLALARGHGTLVVDEVDQYTTSYNIPDGLRSAIHYGRHYNTDIIIAARMPQRIKTDLTAQADIILSAQQQGKSSLNYLDYFADDDKEDEIKNLLAHEFICVAGNFSIDNTPELN